MSTDLLLSTPAPLLDAIERLREAFVITDAEIDHPGPRIIYSNPAFTRLSGYTRAEILGKTPRMLQGPETDRRVLKRLRRCLEMGATFEGETINYRKDGTTFVMRWYIEPVHDMNGVVTHFFALQRDVTAQVAASQQQRVLDMAIGQLSDAVLRFDRNGDVRYTNASYLEWAGLTEEQALQRKVWRLPGAPRGQDLGWARRFLAQGRSWQRQFTVAEPAGMEEERFVFLTISPIRDDEGDVFEFLCVGRDVTERRRLETIAEAHNFHDNLGTIFAGIRHELGNPINSVKAALQVVTAGLDSMPTDKVRGYLERVGGEVTRMEYLLRSLRSYSLHDRPRFESIGLRSFLEGFAQLARGDAERRGVELEVIVDPRGDTVWADPQALHQVLLNLVNNALAALEDRDDGWVQIRSGRIGSHCSIVVKDNGPGIGADHLQNVFKPFYTTRAGGSGLGLAICRHLLSLMRGTVDLVSSPAGTEVRMLLDHSPPMPEARGALSRRW